MSQDKPVLSRADLIFDMIKHGDEKHQAWLREKSYEVAAALDRQGSGKWVPL